MVFFVSDAAISARTGPKQRSVDDNTCVRTVALSTAVRCRIAPRGCAVSDPLTPSARRALPLRTDSACSCLSSLSTAHRSGASAASSDSSCSSQLNAFDPCPPQLHTFRAAVAVTKRSAALRDEQPTTPLSSIHNSAGSSDSAMSQIAEAAITSRPAARDSANMDAREAAFVDPFAAPRPPTNDRFPQEHPPRQLSFAPMQTSTAFNYTAGSSLSTSMSSNLMETQSCPAGLVGVPGISSSLQQHASPLRSTGQLAGANGGGRVHQRRSRLARSLDHGTFPRRQLQYLN